MYKANEERYENMKYVRCGKSGVLIPRIALGFWHNFGSVDNFENQKAMVRKAFDLGITHFDLTLELLILIWRTITARFTVRRRKTSEELWMRTCVPTGMKC